jgi:hypothetical protein
MAPERPSKNLPKFLTAFFKDKSPGTQSAMPKIRGLN